MYIDDLKYYFLDFLHLYRCKTTLSTFLITEIYKNVSRETFYYVFTNCIMQTESLSTSNTFCTIKWLKRINESYVEAKSL